MTIKKEGTAAQGASTPKNEKSSVNNSTTTAKNVTPKVDDKVVQINEKQKKLVELKAYFEELDKNVRTRSLLKSHSDKVDQCLKCFKKKDEFSVEDDREEDDRVNKITLDLKSDSYLQNYKIENPGLMRKVLEFIKSELNQAVAKVEDDLINAS
jgi:hypothetical protein